MVTPSWGSNPTPESVKQENQPKEFTPNFPPFLSNDSVNDNQSESKPSWGSNPTPFTYQGETEKTEEEGILAGLKRNLFQHSARGTEQILGAAGNLESLGRNFEWVNSALNLLLGEPTKQKGGTRETQLPTSKELRELNKNLTQGYSEPKGKVEEHAGELTEDVVSLLRGGGRRSLAKNIGIPVAANAAKTAIKEFGFGDDKASVAKAAVWLPLMLMDSINAPRYASNLMNFARRNTPDTLQFDVPRLQGSLNRILNHPQMLHVDPRSAPARQVIANLQRDLDNGMNTQQALMTAYDGINAAKRHRSMFELGRNDLNFARRQLDRVRVAVGNEIRTTGRQFSPNVANAWQNGVSAWATVHQSQAISNQVERWVRGPYSKLLYGPASALFGVGAFSTYQSSKSALVPLSGAAALPTAYKAAQVAYRVYSNPVLRRYYTAALNAAANENRTVFINNFDKLNKALESQYGVGSKKKNKPNTQ